MRYLIVLALSIASLGAGHSREPVDLERDPEWVPVVSRVIRPETIARVEHMTRWLYGPAWNPSPCSSWVACASQQSACSENAEAGSVVELALWSDNRAEGVTRCTLLCSDDSVLTTTCRERGPDRCTWDDLMPCGRCAPRLPICEDPQCVEDPGACS